MNATHGSDRMHCITYNSGYKYQLKETYKVTIDIKTSGGQLLETINLGALPAGQSNFQWDASKYSGLSSVNFKVNATQGGNTVKSTDLAQDTVTAVGTENGAMSLQLKGRSAVAYSAIKSIL